MSGAPDVAAVLDALERFVRRYVVLTEAQIVAVALWIFHTHAIDASDTTPYLSVTSAEKRSGKTRLLEVLELLVRKALVAANVSPPALFRSLSTEDPRTLLHDEIDAIFGPKANGDEDLRALFNAGYRRGTPVLRCVGDGARQKVEPFNVYGAKALAGIGRLPNTIADRSISIRLKRRSPAEPVEMFRRRSAAEEAEPLHQALTSLAAHHIDALAEARPDLPDELDDRARDAFEQLFAIADLAGGEWPARARTALVALRSQESEDEETAGVRLLADVRTIYKDRNADRLPTAELLEALRADEEAPWADWRGNGLTAHSLARLLGEYGIKSRTIRLPEGGTAKGYKWASFEDSWNRYAPVSPTQNVTPSHPSNHAGLRRDVLHFAETETSRLQPFTDAGCDGVTDEIAEPREIDLGNAPLGELKTHFETGNERVVLTEVEQLLVEGMLVGRDQGQADAVEAEWEEADQAESQLGLEEGE